MRRRLIGAGITLVIGVGVAFAVSGMFGIDPADGDWLTLGGFAAVLAGFPALLALVPTRSALVLLAVIAALFGWQGIAVLNTPGDGAIGGFFLLVVDAVLVVFGLFVIALARSFNTPTE